MNKADPPHTFCFADRRWPLLGLGTMLILLAMAMIFWRERAWLLDVAFQTFLMVKDGTVQVMVYRFGAATVQSLPLLGIKLGVPLALVSWLYSVSFHLHFLGFFLGAAYGFKREDVAIGIALLYVAMTYDGFYWQTSELQQGLGFLLLSWAALLRFPVLRQWWHYVLWALVVVALAFYHPLVFMPFFFFLLWQGWRTEAGIPRRSLWILGSMMLLVLVIKQIWFQNWYDAAKTAQFATNLKAYFPNYFSFPAYGKFLYNLCWYWWGYGLLLLLSLGYLTWQKRWWAINFLLLATAGFLLLSAIGDPTTPYRFYAEVNYYPMLAFALVPVIELLRYLPKKNSTKENLPNRNKQLALLALGLLLASRLLLIGFHSQVYTERVDYLRSLTTYAAQGKQQRYLVPPNSLQQSIMLMDWGLPYESLLQSSVEGPRPITLLLLRDKERSAAEWASDSLFVTPWAAFPLRQVNNNPYWQLPQEPYHDLPSPFSPSPEKPR